MTIFARGPEREIQQFDWFLSGLKLAVPDRWQLKFLKQNRNMSVMEQDGK